MSEIASGVIGTATSFKKRDAQKTAIGNADLVIRQLQDRIRLYQNKYGKTYDQALQRAFADVAEFRNQTQRPTADITADRAREVVQLNNANAAATGNIRSGALLENNAQIYSDIFNTVEQEKLQRPLQAAQAEAAIGAGPGQLFANLFGLDADASFGRASLKIAKGKAYSDFFDNYQRSTSQLAGGVYGAFGGAGGGNTAGGFSSFLGGGGQGII
jgi:hypothetical protein